MEPSPRTSLSRLTKILAFAAAVELCTGLALASVPATIAPLILGAALSNDGTLICRLLGVALLALGLACWPPHLQADSGSPAFRAMVLYNALIALYLTYVGALGHVSGLFLWPIVALHGAVALLLLWTWGDNRQIAATSR